MGADRAHGVIAVLGTRGALMKRLEPNTRYAIVNSLTLRFQLPGASDSIRCSSVVHNHASGYDIGIEFPLMTAAQRERLAQATALRCLVAAA